MKGAGGIGGTLGISTLRVGAWGRKDVSTGEREDISRR